ncbi:unnamed protein product [Phytophthora fragariaefolia]|uniref:Unnamed protein product n=1 Tax=Phytophthora fragariaefolia TaxID=1490495 RepID=A0A9W6Y6E1_9STRA|nr:unnamed protein product [Phytophthora fragariaefolia]
MEAVYETMEKMDLPLRLRERVNEYYKRVWVEYEALDCNINKFQQELTHTLGIEIGLYKHMNLVVMVPFWKDCTPDFLTQIVLKLDIRVYMPDDYVIRRREMGSEMMMINRGYCKLTKPSVDENINADDHPGGLEAYELSEDEGDTSDDLSADDDGQEIFDGRMFDTLLNSSQPANIFTDIRRFRSAHGRRPSYPEGADVKKSRRHREYLYPGQAFGEMSLLMNYKRTANIRAITFVEMCVLNRQDFQNIISRYPQDRRRVLTAMLESCIEKNVIPFPWEKIIDTVLEKRRQHGKKNILPTSVNATMSAKEAARILVETIDVHVPDDSIKYGFQNFDHEFIEDSCLGHVDSTDVKTRETLLRRSSSYRSERGLSDLTSRTENTDDGISTCDFKSEYPSRPLSDNQSNQSLSNLLLLMQSMAKNIEQLQRDVNALRSRDCGHCSNCSSTCPNARVTQRVASTSMLDQRGVVVPSESRIASLRAPLAKEDYRSNAPRKPSIVVAHRTPAATSSTKIKSSGDNKAPISMLRRNRSNAQASSGQDIPHSKREKASARSVKSPRAEVVPLSTNVDPVTQTGIDRYPTNLSSRSRAARNQTLTDMLWSRSNTNGDMLRYTDEERNAARMRRQFRSRRSLPSPSEAAP